MDWRQRTSRRAPRRPSRRRHRPSPPPAPAESGRDHRPPSRRRARASRRAALSRRPRRPRRPPPRRCTLAGTASAAARARAAPPSQAGPALCAPRPPQRLAAPALSGPRAADVRAGVCSVLVGRPSPTSSLFERRGGPATPRRRDRTRRSHRRQVLPAGGVPLVLLRRGPGQHAATCAAIHQDPCQRAGVDDKRSVKLISRPSQRQARAPPAPRAPLRAAPAPRASGWLANPAGRLASGGGGGRRAGRA